MLLNLCVCVWCFQVGFVGTACEDCASGRYGPTCSSGDVHEHFRSSQSSCFSEVLFIVLMSPECSCVHGLCDSGLTGSGRCTCFSGYKGPNCDQGQCVGPGPGESVIPFLVLFLVVKLVVTSASVCLVLVLCFRTS